MRGSTLILNTLDKVIFTVLLLVFFQLPILSNHYLQFVSGYYSAAKIQVEGYQRNATAYHYADVDAMIEDFKHNSNPAVRADAEQKQQTLHQFADLAQALEVLQHGNLLEKTIYIFAPARWPRLNEVLKNFKPGIPLEPMVVGYSVLVALIIGGLFMWPIRRLSKAR